MGVTRSRGALLALALGALAACGVVAQAPGSPAPAQPPSRTATAPPPAAASAPTPPEPVASSAQPPPPDASPPPEPPYDIEADRARIVAQAKEELGPGTNTVTVDDVFVLIGAPGWNRSSLKTSQDLVRNSVMAYLNGRFDRGPTRAIAVYLFASAGPYRSYCKTWLHEDCISPFGFYLAPTTDGHPEGRMIMNAGPGLGTLTHELVHPFVEADFPGAPIWLNEGIASLYEAPVIVARGEIRGVKNWRHPRLLRALASTNEREGAAFDRLFGMSDETFRNGDEDLHYAMARYACQWLDERKLLWPFYRRFRDTADKDPTGAHAFAEVTGGAPAEASAAWSKWVRAL
jgi:hypothetical protein